MAATDNELQELHAQVARSLTAAITPQEIDGVSLPPSAAHIAAAITFLKNNSITASPTGNKALTDLADQLAARRKKKITPMALQEAEEQLQFTLGVGGTVQ